MIDVQIELVIQDTAGQEDLDRLRPPFYLNKDAVIICFAVDNPDSLHNVETLWAPEVKKYCGQAPIILVGNKADLHFSHADADCKLTPDTAHCGQPCVHGTDFNSNALRFDHKDTSHKNHAASSRNNSGGNSGLKASVKKMILCPGCDVTRNSHDHRSVAGPAMAAKIGAVGYFETSAKLNSGVKGVFQAVLSAAASPARFRKKKKLWR
ncbi:hypothetical protein BaRGS_00011519 [Batillaria attramentaria]|uniref:Uncharacterized protein n=1 Tax=Batillaria attramentaria TaxID=370345 RepID=A0ABD0LCV3_9CAEN